MSLRIIFLLLFSVAFTQEKEKGTTETLDDLLKKIPITEGSMDALATAIKEGNDSTKLIVLKIIARMSPVSEKGYKILKEYLSYGNAVTYVHQKATQDLGWEIRAYSAIGLKNVQGNDEEIFRILKKEFHRESTLPVKKAILYTMGERKAASAVPFIVSLLETETDNSLLIECIRALGKIGSKEVFFPLIKIAGGRYLKSVSREASKVLEKIQW